MAAKTLRLGPLPQAGGTDSAGVERVPVVPAGTNPHVAGARGPSTQRATNEGARRNSLFFVALLGIHVGFNRWHDQLSAEIRKLTEL